MISKNVNFGYQHWKLTNEHLLIKKLKEWNIFFSDEQQNFKMHDNNVENDVTKFWLISANLDDPDMLTGEALTIFLGCDLSQPIGYNWIDVMEQTAEIPLTTRWSTLPTSPPFSSSPILLHNPLTFATMMLNCVTDAN